MRVACPNYRAALDAVRMVYYVSGALGPARVSVRGARG